MNLEDIKQVAATQHESTTLEFKKSTAQIKGAGETLCAFLNGFGGQVFVGVTDNGKIVGQEVTDYTKRLIGNTLAQLAPEANINVLYISMENNRKVIVLEARADKRLQPYTFDGKAYIRLESNTITMSREKYQRLSVDNAFNSKGWENSIVEGVEIVDLDAGEILRTIKEGLLNNRIPETAKTDDPMDALQRLGLLDKGRFTNASIVLFAKEPSRWFPQCKIRLARFKGQMT